MQQNGVDTAMDKRNLICTLGQYDIPIVQKQPLPQAPYWQFLFLMIKGLSSHR